MTTKADVAFDLPYYGGYATYTLRAYMKRHQDWTGEDSFTVHALEDDAFLGWGETKDDAIHDAIAGLAPLAEQKSYEAGLVDRPYGRRVLADAGSSTLALIGSLALLSGWIVFAFKAVALAAGVA